MQQTPFADRRENYDTPQSHKPTLLDQVRAAIRVRHYSLRTEEAYVKQCGFMA